MGKNSFWSRLSIVAFMFFAFAVSAMAEQFGDFTYTDNGADITITDYSGADDAVTIPGTILGKPVTGIDAYAFSFADMTSVTIPSTIINIEDAAFFGCEYLASIYIGSGVASIRKEIFDSCNRLASISVDESNPSYSSKYGILFNKDKTTLVLYPMGKSGDYTIPESVTSIGDSAFESCGELTGIVIPDSVSVMGSNAFRSCSKLSTVSIGGGITSIDDDAFDDCDNLSNVTIGDGVNTIGARAFDKCAKLTSIVIPDSVTSIGDNAFSSCYSLSKVSIGDGVASIGKYAFVYCTNLTSINIPKNVTSIGESAFYSCYKLTSIVIHDSVTSIGDNAFSSCYSLSRISMGNGVTSIGADAFFFCEKLASINIPNSVTSIGNYAFACTNLTSIIIPASVTSLGNGVFSSCPRLVTITVDKFNPSYCSVNGVLFNKSKTALIKYPEGKAGAYTIPEGVTSVGEDAFNGCKKITSIVIPDAITNIEDYFFAGCSSLVSITIGNGVTSIGEKAFSGCIRLTSVKLGSSVTSFGVKAFENCSSLISMAIPDSVTSIGDWAFYGCTKLTSVTIGAGTNSISDTAFIGCPALKSITVDVLNSSYCSINGILFNKGQSVVVRCPQGFSGDYTIPDGVTSIGSCAFYDCVYLASITIPGTVTSIENYAFYNCSNLTGIIIPGSVTSIGRSAFFGCSKQTNVSIPGSVTSISEAAFSGCAKLLSITVDELNPSYCSVDGVLFSKDMASLIAYPAGKTGDYTVPGGVSVIGAYAFSGCFSLNRVTIPSSVTHINEGAFYSCPNLKHAIFMGNAPEKGDFVFTDCAWNLKICYLEGATGFPFSWSTWEDSPPSEIYSCTVVFNSAVNGSIAGTATQTVNYGNDCTEVEAVPNTDYHFTVWSGAYNGSANPLTVTNVTEGMTITANFAHNTATLKLDSIGNGSAGITSANTVNTMSDTPIMATPGANSHFTGWTIASGSAVIADFKSAATTVKLTGTHGSSATITANFADNTAPTAVPAAPVVSATDGTFEDRVIVTWKAVPTATSYEVYRNTTKLAPVPGDSLGEVADCIFEDNTADAGATYYYFARAKNSIDWGKFSAGNAGYVAKAPALPGAVTASDGKYFDKIRVSWAKLAGTTSYMVFRTESEATIPDPLNDIPLTETTALFVNDLGDDIVPMDGANVKKYYYWLAAKNANGITLISKSNAGFLSNKGPVTVKAGSGTYSDKVVITWSEVAGATAYDVYRYTKGADGKFTQSETKVGAAVAALEYADTSAVAGTEYGYRMKAKYGVKYDSSFSAAIAAGKSSGSTLITSVNVNNGDTSSNVVDQWKGSTVYFSTEVPLGTTRLVATLNGTSNLAANDCDLYARFGNFPSKILYTAKGKESLSGEMITLSNPSPGTWHFMLYGVTDYTDVTLTVNCYSATDIVLTQIPVNGLPVPSKSVFRGKVVDESGTGIPNMVLQIRNPITGLTSSLSKTDKKGIFSYSTTIGSEGEHTFDFFFTDIPDTAKGTASHTVTTRKGCLEDNNFFDSSSYMPATPVAVPLQADIIGLQNFLNIRNGWTDGTIDDTYATMWVESTLAKANDDDAQPADQLNDGLYLLLYGVEGAGVGNDTTNTSALSAVPFVVHVETSQQGAVLTALNTLGIISGAQKAAIEAPGGTGIIAVTSLSDPDEGLIPVDISLLACEQLELLAKIAAGDASFVEDKTYSGVPSKILTVTLGTGRQINVVAAGFVK
ncbi:MAG TPA: hypothetical protein DET40_02365 [Lentisphaeria bacterium]|nr:MAG: hypothetical protein A2X45_16960 [Lentisphaerae bacterium GWF2_50_93]HCE42376.1 hypothetical protein [Lentisphaeria bacterium]